VNFVLWLSKKHNQTEFKNVINTVKIEFVTLRVEDSFLQLKN